MHPLTKVRQTADRASDAMKARDDAIRAARPGSTIRAIAVVANLSPSRVHQILHGR